MNPQQVYDIIGIGIGPFNLGLAALSAPVEGLNTLFLDQSVSFDWHPGLMLDDATLQVPFMADLVTMADPTSPYSLLNYLKQNNRIYKFYIRESFFVYRREYNLYCQWVAEQLDNCRFGQKVVQIDYEGGIYQVTSEDTRSGATSFLLCRKLVLGTGTQPYIPEAIRKARPDRLIHTADYLHRKTEVVQQQSVTIVGSGQSAAEIFRDLLPETRKGLQLNWITRSGRFFPLENHAKLTLEMTSPDYVDYFYTLSEAVKKNLLTTQQSLYKGINYDLINDIYNSMYAIELADGSVNASLRCNSSLQAIRTGDNGQHVLTFHQEEQDLSFELPTQYVIMATGYKYREPGFLRNIQDRIQRNPDGSFAVHRNYSIDQDASDIYVQNAELHTHGFVSPDLGMGAYRNAFILNDVLGKEVYRVEQKIAFQQFEATTAILQPA
ncbi:lysine N(6)-hydroxylase/L-ornithine N(5)-oxygenase family protein [Taibaiella koreensis]|uniref:lysine N(6)-hydroxylase/L-ornithine N(5)-oxygenase family protein n=1 Tax=Taibaiella koreensis TaxID=1268548 RepID=UPI000E5A05A0|nr:SidA/IucD/PvdA family monooxygenase [Taibaiella koreensis]